MSDCVFCRIVAGELPAHKLYEDERFLAFLDINPVAPGHALVIPKRHAVNLFDFDPAGAPDYLALIRRLALRIAGAVGAADFNVLNASGAAAQQSVGHLHFHIVPRRPGDGLDLWFHGRTKMTNDDLAALAAKIAE
jgi:histidine triad (HIT) family protein